MLAARRHHGTVNCCSPTRAARKRHAFQPASAAWVVSLERFRCFRCSDAVSTSAMADARYVGLMDRYATCQKTQPKTCKASDVEVLSEEPGRADGMLHSVHQEEPMPGLNIRAVLQTCHMCFNYAYPDSSAFHAPLDDHRHGKSRV